MVIAVSAILTLAAPVQDKHRPDKPGCADARRAIVWYRARYNHHRHIMGASSAPPLEHMGCRRAKQRAVYWRQAASSNRAAAARWLKREWAAPPEPFLSIARCENRGDGLYGVNWDLYNRKYEGAYGFLHSTWDAYKPAGFPDSASTATIRQQTDVARILVRTFGGYSSWPACHIRLGLPG